MVLKGQMTLFKNNDMWLVSKRNIEQPVMLLLVKMSIIEEFYVVDKDNNQVHVYQKINNLDELKKYVDIKYE